MDTILFYLFIIYSIIPNIYFRYFSRHVLKKIPVEGKRIAVTFDDGPDPRYTPQLLDLLKKYDIRATFFVLGEKVKANPEIIERIVREGHVIGLHANKHIGAPIRSYKAMKKDFHDSIEVLREMGIKVNLYRPPWGLVNIVSSKFIHEYDFMPVLWSLHASDWSKYVDEEYIEKTLLNKVKPGDIVLLHDGRGAKDAPQRTINALEIALPELQKMGYEFVVPEKNTVISM